MSEELRRILAMVKDGKLSEDQASEMIEALGRSEPQGGEQARYRDEIRHRRGGHRRSHGRHADSEFIEDLGINIGSEVASIIDKSLRGLSSVLGGNSRRFGPTTWLDDSNVNVMSKLHRPEGDGYTCRDNNFTVSKLDGLHLDNARFCDNELHASSIKGTDIDEGEFNGNELRGSSIKDLNISNGIVSNCQLNGVQLADVNVNGGKIDDCAFNGAQLRDIKINGSSLTEGNFNGVKVNDLTITGESAVTELRMNGVKCQDLTINQSRVDALRLSGMNITVLDIESSALSHVTFRNQDWKEMIGRSQLPSPALDNLRLNHFTGENLEFINCTFDETVFGNFEAANMKFIDVDFSELVIETEAALAALAGQQVA